MSPSLPTSLDSLADQPSLAPRRMIAHARATGLLLAGAGAAATATLMWGQVERRLPAVRHFEVPVRVARGTRDLRILQISDLHLYPGQEFLVTFLQRVARTEPVDLVLSTGDSFGSADGLPLVRAAHAPFLGLPGAFVLGSHDYFSPRLRNWAHYLRRDPRVGDQPWTRVSAGLEDEFGSPPAGREDSEPDLPWREFVADLTAAGWADLSNRSATLSVPVGADGGAHVRASQAVSLVGVDDPHISRDHLPEPDASWSDPSALHVAVTHAPYRRVVDAFTRLHADLVIAGHTHGGQIGLPFVGPLVSNCDLPPRYAKGLHTWTAGTDSAPLHVSAGLGTSPFAPIRIAARPEVSILHLRPV